MKIIFDGLDNILGKGENAGNQGFLVFPIMFSKASYS